MSLADWGIVASIAGVVIGAIVVASNGLQRQLDKIHGRIDDHMIREESSATTLDRKIGTIEVKVTEVQQDVAYIAGGLGVDLSRRG